MKTSRVNELTPHAAFVLFISSYFPLFAILIIKQLGQNKDFLHYAGLSLKGVYCLLSQFGISILSGLCILMGCFGISMLLPSIEKDSRNGLIGKVKEISNMNDEVLSYLATYVLPLATLELSGISNLFILIVMLGTTYILFARSKMLLYSPLLLLFGYSIYSFSFLYGDRVVKGTIITKNRDIQTDDTVQVYNIGNEIYIVNKQ